MDLNYIKKIFKSALTLLSAEALSLILATIFSILLGRLLGAEILGTYSIAFVIATIIRTLIDAGFDISIPRDSLSGIDPKSLINNANKFKIISFAITLIPAILLWFSVSSGFAIIIILIWNLIISLSSSYKSLLRANEKFSIISRTEALFNIILYSILFSIFTFTDLYLIYLAYLLTEAIKLFVYTKLTKQFLSNDTNTIAKYSYVELFKNQYKLIIVNLLSVAQYRIPQFSTAWFAGDAALGHYSGAMRFLTLLRIIPGTILNTMLPEFSKPEPKKIKLVQAFSLATLIGISISLAMYFLSDLLIKYTYDFVDAVPILQILSFTFLPVSLNLTLEAFLLSKKLESQVNKALLLSFIFILGFSFYLCPQIGAMGSAIAALSGESALTLLYLIIILNNYIKK